MAIGAMAGKSWGALVPDSISMNYAAPPCDLTDWISSLYSLQQNVDRFEQTERPDRPQLRIIIQGAGHYIFPDGRAYVSRPVMLHGPSTGPFVARGTGPVDAYGVGLMPAAWGTLMGPDAENSVDCAVDAEALFGDRATRLYDDIRAAPDIDARFALIVEFIREVREAACDGAPVHFIRIMDAWLEEGGEADVAILSEKTGLSRRQVERLSKRYYGMPPRSLARKYRAVRTMAALARGDDIDELGLGSQYYDQSHLIREMKRFAGLTPQQIKKRQSALLVAVSRGRKSLSGKVGGLTSDA